MSQVIVKTLVFRSIVVDNTVYVLYSNYWGCFIVYIVSVHDVGNYNTGKNAAKIESYIMKMMGIL